MRKSGVILEDKEIFGVNKVHRNVLRPMPRVVNKKSRVYYDPSEEDPLKEIEVNSKMLELVSENIKFDSQVIKSKAQHTIPYSPTLTQEIFSNALLDRAINDYRIPSARERLRIFKKKSAKFKNSQTESEDLKKIQNSQLQISETMKHNESKFTPISYFKSISEEDLKGNTATTTKTNMTKSLDELNKAAKNVFLTESVVQDSEWDWDCQLIDELSENTARWMVMKKIERDVKQKEKLLSLIEEKFGRFTRNVDDLDLFEDSLTEFEKQKIIEEKERFRQEKLKKKLNKSVRIKESDEKDQVPLYRLPQGLKHLELEKLRMPDSNFNTTAKNISVITSRVESPRTFQNQMEKSTGISDMTLMKSENAYVNEMLIKNNHHMFTRNEGQIILENGPAFKKDLEPVYPIQFTKWVADIDLSPVDKPQLKRPTKGKRRWKTLPELIVTDKINEPVDITVENNYWHLMPTTADTELRKVLGSNLTVAKIIEEWRKKWQTSTRWSQAEIDELLTDMSNESAHVRFQALVICSRAIENKQQLKSKFAKYARKTSKNNENIRIIDDDDDSTVFGISLFSKIVSLLSDSNQRCRLAASIAVFTWLRGRSMPFSEINQTYKDKAESLLREALSGANPKDKFTAALCLSNIGGMCDKEILDVLIDNYFDSREQYTREQVVRSLAYLSNHFPTVTDEIGNYLWSEKARERMLACKLLPCMHTTISQKITGQLVNMMWNDINKQARKLAAQILGRTGRGRFVHDEIYTRLSSPLASDRVEALKKIDQIGIMTNKLIGGFLKCFRDDYFNVRELACKACQGLNYDKSDDKLVEALVFVARFDRSTKLKAMAIRTLGLIGDGRLQIRNCLLWALQFENEPLIRTEACHSLVLVVNDFNDNEIIDVLLERNLVEEEPIVHKQIRDALIYFGRDPNKELPIVAKIKADIKKLNDKKFIIKRIYEMEKEEKFQIDKKLLIGEQIEPLKEDSSFDSTKSLEIFKPKKHRQKSHHKNNPLLKRASFLSTLVSNMDEQAATSIDKNSPHSSSSPSVSIEFDSPDLEEMANKSPSPNHRNNSHRFETKMATDLIVNNNNNNQSKISTSNLSKHIVETIVEET